MPTKNVYFETDGIAWNNLKQGPQASVTGTALVLEGATSAKMVINIDLAICSIWGTQVSGALDQVTATYPDGSTDTLYSAAYGCGTFPIEEFCSGSFSKTIDLSNYANYAGQSITISATSFGFPNGAAYNCWKLNSYIAEDIPVTPATVDFTVTAGGSPLSSAIISGTDTTTNQPYSLTTNSSGQATLSGVNVGDSITINVSESGYSSVTETITIYHTSSDVTIPLTATTTGNITTVLKNVAIVGGVIAGSAVVYEVAKAVSEHEGAKELFLDTGAAMRQRATNAYNKVRGR